MKKETVKTILDELIELIESNVVIQEKLQRYQLEVAILESVEIRKKYENNPENEEALLEHLIRANKKNKSMAQSLACYEKSDIWITGGK